jgi:hypothetical protein
MDLQVLSGDSFDSLYVDDVRTSEETLLWTSTACYGDSFNSLYVDDVRTSEESLLWTSTACYEDTFTLLSIKHGDSFQRPT